MQALKEDPPADFKCKDKFLVQSIAITAERAQLPAADLVRENKEKDKNEPDFLTIWCRAHL